MSKITIVGGDIIEYIGGKDLSYAEEEIINIGSEVIQTGEENGVIYGINRQAPPISDNVSLKMFMINFRRQSTYNGEFGFDWMRDEYIYPITNVRGVNKELCLTPAKLKTEYKTTDVTNAISPYGKDYYCSFLNIFFNQEVTLDIEVEELEALSPDDTEIVFESSNPDLVVTPANIPLNTLIAGGKLSKNLGGISTKNYYLAANQVKVKCNKAFTKNEQVKVFAKLKDPTTGIEDNKEVGKMMVMKNSAQAKYTINVYVIKSYIIDDPNFGEAVIDAKINSKGGLQAFEDYLNKQSLNQSLIQVKFIYNTIGKPFDWGFRKISIENASKEDRYKGMLIDRAKMIVDTGSYMGYINDRFNLMFPELMRKKGIFLYLTSLDSPDAGGASQTSPLDNKNCIIYMSNLNLFSSYAHEIGHTLGLEHTFQDNSQTNSQRKNDAQTKLAEYQSKLSQEKRNKANMDTYKGYYATHPEEEKQATETFNNNVAIYEKYVKYYEGEIKVINKNPYKFEKNTTENIMDYDLSNRVSFFKWQWKIMEDETQTYYHE